MGSAVHVDVHAWGVSYVGCKCSLQQHGRYGLSCLYAETVECMRSAGSVRYFGVEVLYMQLTGPQLGGRQWAGKPQQNRGQCQQLFSGSHCHRVGINSSFVAVIATGSRCQQKQRLANLPLQTKHDPLIRAEILRRSALSSCWLVSMHCLVKSVLPPCSLWFQPCCWSGSTFSCFYSVLLLCLQFFICMVVSLYLLLI